MFAGAEFGDPPDDSTARRKCCARAMPVLRHAPWPPWRRRDRESGFVGTVTLVCRIAVDECLVGPLRSRIIGSPWASSPTGRPHDENEE